jgi:ethanolamine kinase
MNVIQICSRFRRNAGVASRFTGQRLFSTPLKRNEIQVAYEPLENGDLNQDSLRSVVSQTMKVYDGTVLDTSNIHFSVVTGGITNKLYKCTLEGHSKGSILVRIFGGEGMIDRDIETETFIALSDQGVGAEYIGLFENGRVEGWIENANPLELEDMGKRDVYEKVAVELARLHQVQKKLPLSLQQHYGEPNCWAQLFSWLKQAKVSINTLEAKWGEDTAERFHEVHQAYFGEGEMGNWTLDRIEGELDALSKSIPQDLSPSVFAHNDLLAGNILLNQTSGHVHLIDFEYGGSNYRGFDIANHWNEWAGGTQEHMNGVCEYHRFPSENDQLQFCQAYLQEAEGSSVGAPKLVEEANAYVLVNHWYWGLWAINQAVMEGVDGFDYITYAESRARQYYQCKK